MADGIERELRLDVGAALDSIGSLNDAFLQTVDAFSTGLDAALAILSSVTIGDVDATPVSDAITAAITDASGTPATIEGDATPVTDAIDTAVADANSTVDLIGDAGAIPADIEDAIASANTVVDVSADVTQAQDAIDSLQATPIDVEVDANTDNAQNAIDGLSQSASGGTTSLGNLKGAAEGFGVAAELGAGSATGLAAGIGSASAGAGAAAGAFAALGGFIGEVVSKATGAQTAQLQFNRVLGQSADAISHINVGGLNTTLEDLGKTTGTTTAGLELTTAGIVQMGKSSGDTVPQAGAVADKLLAIGSALSVTKPQLGDAADVTTNLERALIRGGRALVPFNISLTAAQIAAEGVKEGLAATSADLSTFDKITAGANLVAAQYGNTLGSLVKDGAQSAAVQFRQLKTTVEEFLVQIGTPLIAPVLDFVRAAVPSFEAFATILGQLAQAALPALQGPLEVLGGLLHSVSVVISAIPPPLLSAGIAFLAVSKSVEELAGAMGSLGSITGGLGFAIEAFSGPIGIAVGVLAAGAAAFKLFGSSSDDAAKHARDGAKTILGASSDLQSTTTAIDGLSKSIDTLANSADGFGSASKLIRTSMEALGLTNRDLQAGLTGTDAAFQSFTSSVQDAATKQAPFVGDALAVTQALQAQRQALEDGAKARIDAFVQSGSLSKADEASAVAANKARDGTINYVGALAQVTTAAQKANDALAAQKEVTAEQGLSWDSLAVSILHGKTSLDDLSGISDKFGVDSKVLSQFFTDIQKSLDTFVTDATKALPTADDAFKSFQKGVSDAFTVYQDATKKAGPASQDAKKALEGLNAASDPNVLIHNLQAQAQAIDTFQRNVNTLLSQGFTRAAEFVIKEGPIVGGQLAQSLVSGNKDTAKALDGTLTILNQKYADYAGFIHDKGGPQILSATGQWASSVTGVVKDNLDLQGASKDAIHSATAAFANDHGLTTASSSLAVHARQVFNANLTLDQVAAERTKTAGIGITANQGVVGDAAGGAGKTGADTFGKNLDLASKGTGAINQAALAIQEGATTLNFQVAGAGAELGGDFGRGIAQGVNSTQGLISNAVVTAILVAEQAGRTAAKSKSPSLLFAELGKDLVDGLIQPFFDPRIGKASTAALAQLSGGISGAHLAVPNVATSPSLAASLGSGQHGPLLQIDKLSVTVANGSEAEAVKAAKTITDAIPAELFKRALVAQVRA